MARLSYNEVREKQSRENKKRYLSQKGAFKTVRKVWHYARPYRYYMFLTLLTDLIASITEIFIPIFMGKAINCAVGPGLVDFGGITINLLLMLIMVVLTALFYYLSSLCVNAFAFKTSFRFRELFFKKMNTVPLNYIDTNSHGDLLSRMVNDIDLVCDGFLESIASLLSGLTTIIGTIIAMYILNFKMATIILVLTPLSIVIAFIIVKRSKKYFRMEVQNEGLISGYLEEYISGERVVKMFGHEEETIKDFEKINQNYYEVGEKSQFYGNLTNPATRFVNGVVYGVVGLVGALLVLGGEPGFSIGVVSTFLSYANSFGRPFNEVSSEISDIQTAFAAAARVFSVLDEEDEPSDEHLPELTTCDGTIEINNVNFSYIPKTKLIENFNLKVEPGQKIAIVGPTGCGKTTLINLLMRFYEINSGTIFVSGQNTKEITRASLRNKFGMVLQDSWLFEGTIKQNIAYGNPNIKLEEVIEAAKKAGVHDFIMKMKDGYFTKVTEGGTNLSQGEKQLLCIARIILLKPSMLILDEATSNIDTRTELKIQESFDNLMEGRTCFIVAHRLSTITNADKILVMNKGNIIEQGTHKELLEQKGFYFNLYNSQFANKQEDEE